MSVQSEVSSKWSLGDGIDWRDETSIFTISAQVIGILEGLGFNGELVIDICEGVGFNGELVIDTCEGVEFNNKLVVAISEGIEFTGFWSIWVSSTRTDERTDKGDCKILQLKKYLKMIIKMLNTFLKIIGKKDQLILLSTKDTARKGVNSYNLLTSKASKHYAFKWQDDLTSCSH